MAYEHLTVDFLDRYLSDPASGFKFIESRRDESANGLEKRFWLEEGTISRYTTGTTTIQGDKTGILADRLKKLDAKMAKPPRVFIVFAYKDSDKKDKVVDTLRSWGLDVGIMVDQPGRSKYLLEKLKAEIEVADFGLVLLTPDKKIEGEDSYTVRPNIWLELGMLIWHFKDQRERYSLLHFDDQSGRQALHLLAETSDILGVSCEMVDDQVEDELEKTLWKEISHLFEV